jgi:pimeloyl-ACP methyl ester carboxylesterase
LAQFKAFKWLRKYFYRAIWSQDYINAENTPYLKETYLNMINSDLREEIKDIKIQTLLIWWEKDTYTPLSDWKFMNKNILNSKLVILSDEKHWIHLKSPKKLIETFLKCHSEPCHTGFVASPSPKGEGLGWGTGINKKSVILDSES